MSDDFFAPPPFKPADALQRLLRDLRELGLTERDGQFELRGRAVAKAHLDSNGLSVALVRELARTPQWQTAQLSDHTALRDWLSRVKTQLARWRDHDDRG